MELDVRLSLRPRNTDALGRAAKPPGPGPDPAAKLGEKEPGPGKTTLSSWALEEAVVRAVWEGMADGGPRNKRSVRAMNSRSRNESACVGLACGDRGKAAVASWSEGCWGRSSPRGPEEDW